MSLASLNQGQSAAFDACVSFLMSNDLFFSISGPAGTGKTFLMNTISEVGLEHYVNACKLIGVEAAFSSAAFTATTNKAAEVLEQAIDKPVQTIHSFLRLKVQENWRTGKTELSKLSNWAPKPPMVLFIDEASMIDTSLFELILETLPGSKIIFVGDHAQMAPVNEELSPIFTKVDPQNFAVLTEPVRNANSPALMELCQQWRDTVETGIFKPIKHVPGVVEFLDMDSMPEKLEEVFADLNPSSRVLCYTNERVQLYNDFIRQDARNQPPEFCVGDVLVVAQAYQKGKLSLSVEREVKVLKVGDIEEDNSHLDVLGEPLLYRKYAFSWANGTGRFEDIRVAVDRAKLSTAVKHYAKRKAWSDYFDLKGLYLDVRDKASCTVYKAQGSTYDNVFVDIGNIGTSFNAQQVARMIYVAVSRPRSQIFFYGQLPNRYHDSHGEPVWTPTPGQLALSTAFSNVTNAA